MTREERVKLIEYLRYSRSIGADYTITDKDADEIIKALEQEPILDKIRAEITNIETCGQVDSHTSFIRTGEQVKNIAIGIVDKYRQEG